MSKNEKTFQVKTIKGEHSCYRVANSLHCNSKYLAKKYEYNIRSNPEWPVNSMQESMQRDNKTSLSVWKMYRAKKHVSILSSGTELEQYAKLWDYFEEIYRTNPDTTIKVKCKHDVGSQTCIFKRLYICWGALKKGFMSGCRPIIGLDGTHLKTSTGGLMLCVVGVDGNNNMYPIAYAVVLKENTKSWKWFVSLLIDDLCIENSFTWSIISDKQKGLLKAIELLLPNAEHRFCLRHMYNNFKQKHRGLQLKEILWKAASATRLVDFNNEMEKLKASDKAAYQWVMERDPKHWAKYEGICDRELNIVGAVGLFWEWKWGFTGAAAAYILEDSSKLIEPVILKHFAVKKEIVCRSHITANQFSGFLALCTPEIILWVLSERPYEPPINFLLPPRGGKLPV
ncbi:hypothetical protein KSP39_PZI023385 [Platanthera zijinensis]|uniref:MULE transposase domain-containing protein n=1 Tax=Platanthera zijinensis TaxID=2320716 RepID=A0AAP0FUT0_9ASPA